MNGKKRKQILPQLISGLHVIKTFLQGDRKVKMAFHAIPVQNLLVAKFICLF